MFENPKQAKLHIHASTGNEFFLVILNVEKIEICITECRKFVISSLVFYSKMRLFFLFLICSAILSTVFSANVTNSNNLKGNLPVKGASVNDAGLFKVEAPKCPEGFVYVPAKEKCKPKGWKLFEHCNVRKLYWHDLKSLKINVVLTFKGVVL